MKNDSVMYFVGILFSITMGTLGILHYLWVRGRSNQDSVSEEKINQTKSSLAACEYEDNKKVS